MTTHLEEPNVTNRLTFDTSTMLAIFCPQQTNHHVMITMLEAYSNHVCSIMDRVLQRTVVVVLVVVGGGGGGVTCVSCRDISAERCALALSNSAFICSIGSEKMAQCS